MLTLAPRLAYQTSHASLRQHKVRLGCIDSCLLDRDLHLKRLRVKFHKHVAFSYAIVVIDEDASHLTANARRDESHVTIHLRVVSRDSVQRVE